jgi:hypothetical protein
MKTWSPLLVPLVAASLLACPALAKVARSEGAASAPLPSPTAPAAADTTIIPTLAVAPPPHVRAWQTGLLRSDRLQHGSLSFTLAAGAGLAGRTRIEAVGVTLGLGLAKELHDGRHGRFDVVDLAADTAGALLGAFAAARR